VWGGAGVRDRHEYPGHGPSAMAAGSGGGGAQQAAAATPSRRSSRLRSAWTRRVPLGHVDPRANPGVKEQSGEAHRGAHHLADERLELPSIAEMHEGPVVHGEAASPSRRQQLDPLLAQQRSSVSTLCRRSFSRPLPRQRTAAACSRCRGRKPIDARVRILSPGAGRILPQPRTPHADTWEAGPD